MATTDHLGGGHGNGDLHGDSEKDGQFARGTLPANDNLDGEYNLLVRYISQYKDGRQPSIVSSLGDEKPKKKHFWSSSKGDSESGVFETPDDWLTTDWKHGLTGALVEQRRRKTGWNELSSEETNLFLQFLGYFKGPILYGMCSAPIDHFSESLTNQFPQLWNSLSSSPPVFVIGSILVLSVVFFS